MVSATVKVLSLLSGVIIMSTPSSLLHVMPAVTVKLDGAPAIKCMHSDITVQFTAYACTCKHIDPWTHTVILTTITPLCYITTINILIPSVVATIHTYCTHTVSAQMLTFEDHICHGLRELYTLAALSQHFDSRSNEDHELLYSPYKHMH